MIYKLNNEIFNITVEHRIGDVNYPRNWFQDAENRATIGITEEPEPIQPPYVSTPEEVIAQLEEGVDAYINQRAAEKGYDSRITVCMRTGYVSPWQQECINFALWMDAIYVYCYQVIADVQGGLRTIPSIEELISEFPILSWEGV